MNEQNRSITIEVGLGELVDKITILEIKEARIRDATKLANVIRELDTLRSSFDAVARREQQSDKLSQLIFELRQVNELLWDIEEKIRECEGSQDFGDGFIALARSVYQQNDRRAELKRSINVLLGSRIIEEKDYSCRRVAG